MYVFQMVYSDSLVSLQGKKYKVAHVVCSLICWLLPCIPVGIVLGSKTASYDVMFMRMCFPNGEVGFFTSTFIPELAQGVGCTFLLVVVYKLFVVSFHFCAFDIFTLIYIVTYSPKTPTQGEGPASPPPPPSLFRPKPWPIEPRP